MVYILWHSGFEYKFGFARMHAESIRRFLCSLIHFIRQQNRSHNVKFQLRGNGFFSQLKPTEFMYVCTQVRILAWIWSVCKGFLLLLVGICAQNGSLNGWRRCDAVSIRRVFDSFAGYFTENLFIYCQANFKRYPLPISLKGNDILQFHSIMKRMVNILCHLSVVVLGSLFIKLIE